MNVLQRLASLAVIVTLAACSSPVKLDKGAGAGAAAGAGGSNDVSGAVTAPATASAASAAGAGDATLGAQRVIYFDLDSDIIKDEFRPIVETQAKRLAADKKLHITVEGNTDERGSTEYNLALGQRRAEAVVKALKLLGAGDGQLEAVSFGKERPVEPGHDEAAWARNRRAELKDR